MRDKTFFLASQGHTLSQLCPEWYKLHLQSIPWNKETKIWKYWMLSFHTNGCKHFTLLETIFLFWSFFYYYFKDLLFIKIQIYFLFIRRFILTCMLFHLEILTQILCRALGMLVQTFVILVLLLLRKWRARDKIVLYILL